VALLFRLFTKDAIYLRNLKAFQCVTQKPYRIKYGGKLHFHQCSRMEKREYYSSLQCTNHPLCINKGEKKKSTNLITAENLGLGKCE
jgi:hypothetical protein